MVPSFTSRITATALSGLVLSVPANLKLAPTTNQSLSLRYSPRQPLGPEASFLLLLIPANYTASQSTRVLTLYTMPIKHTSPSVQVTVVHLSTLLAF